MDWFELGTVNLSRNWQYLQIASIGDEVFRIRQSYSYRINGYCLVAPSYYNGTDFGSARRIYPNDQENRIIQLPIPQEFKASGNIVRYIALKMVNRVIEPPGFTWSVSVDIYQ